LTVSVVAAGTAVATTAVGAVVTAGAVGAGVTAGATGAMGVMSTVVAVAIVVFQWNEKISREKSVKLNETVWDVVV
jgi:hypothetical protein